MEYLAIAGLSAGGAFLVYKTNEALKWPTEPQTTEYMGDGWPLFEGNARYQLQFIDGEPAYSYDQTDPQFYNLEPGEALRRTYIEHHHKNAVRNKNIWENRAYHDRPYPLVGVDENITLHQTNEANGFEDADNVHYLMKQSNQAGTHVFDQWNGPYPTPV